jgi:uncharacterized membrane protein YdbT with pleckstrin-like domain
MSYVSENLRPGEKLVLEARLTPLSFLFSLLWSWLLLFIPTLLLYLRYIRTELGVTDRRVIEKSGILSVTTAETTLDKVQNVTFSQSILGRIFDYGTVVIQSAATMGAEGIRGVSGPKEVRDTILQQMDLYRVAQIREQAEAIAKSIQQRPQTG